MRKRLISVVILCGLCASMLGVSLKNVEEQNSSLVNTEQEENTPKIIIPEKPNNKCGKEHNPWTYYDPDTCKPYDLGGMEILILDGNVWEEWEEPANSYEEYRKDYRDWIQETYHFTVREVCLGEEDLSARAFMDYVDAGGDEKNYAYALTQDSELIYAIENRYMYDLSGLEWLDFSERKWERNKVHEQYTTEEGQVYAMKGEAAQPGVGLFFNKRLLTRADVDPESLYDMQASGTWTWEACMDIISMVKQATGSGDIVDFHGYEKPSEAQWQLYREAFKNGENAFLLDEVSQAAPGMLLYDMEDEIGFVTVPQGPNGENYEDWIREEVLVIPGCYDVEKAKRIAFAYNLWTDEVPGFEDIIYLEHYWKYNLDSRALSETIVGMVADTLDMNPPRLEMGEYGEWWIWLKNIEGRDR